MLMYNHRSEQHFQKSEREMDKMSKERNVTVNARCNFCGKTVELKVTEESIAEYFSPNRRHIQDIFPYLTAGERELLISHMCEECWDKMFSFDEEDEEDEEDFSDYEEYLKMTEISVEELKEVF